MLTIKSELKVLTEKSHLCYPQSLTRLHLSSQKWRNRPQANKEAYLELFRVFLALHLVEFQCFGGHFENEYQVRFKVGHFSNKNDSISSILT